MEKDDEVKGDGNSLDFGARMYDARIGRWFAPDKYEKKYPNISPYSFSENSPLYLMDYDGNDAVVTINGNNITIKSKIILYGEGATNNNARQYQDNIMATWGVKQDGSNWTYTDKESGKVYNVKFDVSVELYGGEEKASPFLIPESWNPSNTDNFIEASPNSGRSYVTLGDEGVWRSEGRDGLTLAQDDSAPHEFGHLLGLDDRYFEGGGKQSGWSGNIMAEPAMEGVVEQKNIDAILAPVVNEYNTFVKQQVSNKTHNTNVDKMIQAMLDCKCGSGMNIPSKRKVENTNTFETKIDISHPSN